MDSPKRTLILEWSALSTAAVDDRVDPWYPPWVAGVQYWMDRMATSPTPIVEKMALFWHGLFTSSVDKMYPRLVFKHNRNRSAILRQLIDRINELEPAV